MAEVSRLSKVVSRRQTALLAPRPVKVASLAGYVPCAVCRCTAWRGKAEACGSCNHDKDTHTAKLQALSDAELDLVTGMLSDVETIYSYIHKEQDGDAKQSLLVIYKHLRSCIAKLVPATLKPPPVELPNMQRCMANFAHHKFSTLPEFGTMQHLCKLVLNCINAWKLPPPGEVRRRADRETAAAYRTLYPRWLYYCRIPHFCESFARFDTAAIFGRPLLMTVLPLFRPWLAEKLAAERERSAQLSQLLNLLDNELFDDSSPVWRADYALPEQFVFSPLQNAVVFSPQLSSVSPRSPSPSPRKRDMDVDSDMSPAFVERCVERLRNCPPNPHLAHVAARDDGARAEELRGDISVFLVNNSLTQTLDERVSPWLLETMNLFSLQLPRMPRSYLTKLVFDPNHRNLVLVRHGRVIGAICFYYFPQQGFSEIVFCAVLANEQVKGYGTHMMNHLKDWHTARGATTFLTFADEFAVGYFAKQGFSTTVSLDKSMYQGFTKEYEGATLMSCELSTKIRYTALSQTLHKAQALLLQAAQLRREDACKVVTVKTEVVDPEILFNRLKTVLKQSKMHPSAWPFHKPVDAEEAPDYAELIHHPMDLKTMSERHQNKYYTSKHLFVADFRRMFANCRSYNEKDTDYYKCANTLERFLVNKYPDVGFTIAPP